MGPLEIVVFGFYLGIGLFAAGILLGLIVSAIGIALGLNQNKRNMKL